MAPALIADIHESCVNEIMIDLFQYARGTKEMLDFPYTLSNPFFFFQYTNSTEITKIFQVNLSSVTLKQSDMATADSPRIDENTRLMEVVIAQPNQTLGELDFDVSALVDPATQAIVLNEEVGMLNITAQRTGIFAGTVGFKFIARPLISSVYSAADDSDFSPSGGTVLFTPGISNQLFHVSITNDDVPEIKEGFYVQISRPIGGVTIGPRSKVDVVIEPNDEPYGRFGYVYMYYTAKLI